MAGDEEETVCGTDGGPTPVADEGVCPDPFAEDDAPVKQTFSGELLGGVIIEDGLICHVPDGWPLNIFPKYKAPCSKCGEDCTCPDAP